MGPPTPPWRHRRATRNDGIAIWIAGPELAVIPVRIAVNVEQDGRADLACTRHGGVEVVELKPQEHAVGNGA
jgi:hypothetical protein